ncbi:NAD(P)-binding protein [Xylariaceae sp. FL0594]|nr:NAD(P)-binding protein [Xylariaceae sp. FL0594]
MATVGAVNQILRTSLRPTSSPARCCARLGAGARAATSKNGRFFLTRESVRWKSGPYGYTQAKALVFSEYGEPKDVLKLHTHSISPSQPSDTILLRTLAASINPADVNTIQGTYGVKPKFSPLIGTQQPSVIGGNEGVFEVLTSSPPSASGLSKGDWVIPAKTGFGTWRTHVAAPFSSVLKIDKEGLDVRQAGTASVNPCSAYRMLRDYQPLREGDWFIQNGANSGVGRAAIQLGRLWGYSSINVIRARPTQEETDALKKELEGLGATHVVTEDEFQSRDFRDKLAHWTAAAGPSGLKLGLNCVGGKSAQAIARSLASGGTMVTYGGMSKQPVNLPTGLLIFKDIRFVGFWLSRWADADTASKARTVNEVLDLVREGKFRDTPVVDVPWSWDTEEKVLTDAVQGTLEGFRAGKGVFVFGET